MLIEDTGLPGAKILPPKRFGDHRGVFGASWNSRMMAAAAKLADFETPFGYGEPS